MSRAEDMARLRDECTTLRSAREEFIEGLRSNLAEMRAGFRHTHAEMAREQREALDANEGRRKQQAKDAHAGRVAFVAGMKRTVAGLRREFAAENAAARRAWFGRRPAEPSATERAA